MLSGLAGDTHLPEYAPDLPPHFRKRKCSVLVEPSARLRTRKRLGWGEAEAGSSSPSSVSSAFTPPLSRRCWCKAELPVDSAIAPKAKSLSPFPGRLGSPRPIGSVWTARDVCPAPRQLGHCAGGPGPASRTPRAHAQSIRRAWSQREPVRCMSTLQHGARSHVVRVRVWTTLYTCGRAPRAGGSEQCGS